MRQSHIYDSPPSCTCLGDAMASHILMQRRISSDITASHATLGYLIGECWRQTCHGTSLSCSHLQRRKIQVAPAMPRPSIRDSSARVTRVFVLMPSTPRSSAARSPGCCEPRSSFQASAKLRGDAGDSRCGGSQPAPAQRSATSASQWKLQHLNMSLMRPVDSSGVRSPL